MKRAISVILVLAMALSISSVFALPLSAEGIAEPAPEITTAPELTDEPIPEVADPISEAEESQTDSAVTEPIPAEPEILTATYSSEGAADNDELFDQYVMDLFYGGGVQTYAARLVRDTLDDNTGEVYDKIKSKIMSIADGTLSSSVFEGLTFSFSLQDSDEYFDLAFKAVNALLVDCPSEFYWYDKTVGTYCGLSYNGSSYALTVKLAAAKGYQKNGDLYTVDSSAIERAKTAVKNAQNIVNQAPAGTADKLKYFKDEICEMVDYGYDALSSSYYGDSYQLTNVFDGDVNTNVVCEGYSKAFQYLCEIAGIECYTVTGWMDGGTGAGPHMWNIVRLDGASYVVDVTNCDAGTIGAPDKLFLKGVTLTDGGYIVAGVAYTYESETTSMLSPSILTPSTADYVVSADKGWALDDSGVLTIKTDAGMTDWAENGRVNFGSKVKMAVIQDGVKSVGGYAFYGCTSLTSVTIPGSVEIIGNYAFQGCTNLTDIYCDLEKAPDGWDADWQGVQDPETGRLAEVHWIKSGPDYIPGDVNGDGIPNNQDAIFLLKCIMAQKLGDLNQNADMNGDGNINNQDAIYLLKHIMNPGSNPLKNN